MSIISDIFYAGVGAVAMSVDKGQEALETLVEEGKAACEKGGDSKGELSRNRGISVGNAVSKVAASVSPFEELGLEARLNAMNAEDRASFMESINKVAAAADKRDAERAVNDAVEEVEAEVEEVVEDVKEAVGSATRKAAPSKAASSK